MSCDLIITTYNRPRQTISLIRQVLDCVGIPNRVIVVDSSDEPDHEILSLERVTYIYTSHKNQPYQRLLGAKASNADIIVFFDDDLDITNSDLFAILLAEYRSEEVMGATLGMDYCGTIADQMEEAVMYPNAVFANFIFALTGVAQPKAGRAGRLGFVGKKPAQKGPIEFFYGPCMSFRRALIEELISPDVLSLYERKLGKGEDKAISMKAGAFGKLIYIPTISLYHAPNDSTYFQNIRSFTAKVTYSRLYLSRIYAQVFHKPWWREVLIYYWFTAWRVLIALFSLLIRPSKGRKDKLLGAIDGLWLAR
jgi:glycosyltransferase involved in cell wall biosynthesis